MDTFGRPHMKLTTPAEHLLELVDPHASGIDRLLRANREGPSRLKITDFDAGDAICLPQEADHSGAGGNGGAIVSGGAADHHGVPGVVDQAFIELDRADHIL